MLSCLMLVLMEQVLVYLILSKVQFSYEKAWETFTSQEIVNPIWDTCVETNEPCLDSLAEYLTVYQMLSGMTGARGDKNLSKQWLETGLSQDEVSSIANWMKQEYPDAFWQLYSYNHAIWSGINAQKTIVFPVGKVVDNPWAGYEYENSWGMERTYGGERKHEGCDIMATVNERGIYPIYSVSRGVIEKMGWLPQGGYRIGIRSGEGVYFYYAHLASYAPQLAVGDTVEPGTLLGMMGDSGYSQIEGTTGNFPVHLHFGIYLNQEDGKEFAVNSYYFLKVTELLSGR